jgi:hypothetical protein
LTGQVLPPPGPGGAPRQAIWRAGRSKALWLNRAATRPRPAIQPASPAPVTRIAVPDVFTGHLMQSADHSKTQTAGRVLHVSYGEVVAGLFVDLAADPRDAQSASIVVFPLDPAASRRPGRHRPDGDRLRARTGPAPSYTRVPLPRKEAAGRRRGAGCGRSVHGRSVDSSWVFRIGVSRACDHRVSGRDQRVGRSRRNRGSGSGGPSRRPGTSSWARGWPATAKWFR